MVLLAIHLARTEAGLRAWSASHGEPLALLCLTERDAAIAAYTARLLVLEVEAIPSLPALAAWWSAAQPRLQSLDPAGRAAVIAAKDAAKKNL